MKQVRNLTALAVIIFSLAACQKQGKFSQEDDLIKNDELTDINSLAERGNGARFVYTLNNQVNGNAVLLYKSADNGKLTFAASYPTGGSGTGGGLGNQGAVSISDDGKILLAVNSGSNSISSFKITGNGLQLRSTVESGGIRPVSITQHEDVVYVLNAGGDGNIAGFKLTDSKKLIAIPNAVKPLSSTGSGAAQIAFTKDGKVVVITEKATNKIITYTVNEHGHPGMMHSITSATPTPFGFYALDNGNIFVSEAAGGAASASKLSSYHVSSDGAITLRTASVGANQSAACWVVITNNEKYAFTTNTASNNLTSFDINKYTAGIAVNTAIASVTEVGPIDAALSSNSKFLYVLNSGSNSIGAYAVGNDGSLSNVQTITGLPAGANGLASK
jgi:6-phosphogluconolactonase